MSPGHVGLACGIWQAGDDPFRVRSPGQPHAGAGFFVGRPQPNPARAGGYQRAFVVHFLPAGSPPANFPLPGCVRQNTRRREFFEDAPVSAAPALLEALVRLGDAVQACNAGLADVRALVAGGAVDAPAGGKRRSDERRRGSNGVHVNYSIEQDDEIRRLLARTPPATYAQILTNISALPGARPPTLGALYQRIRKLREAGFLPPAQPRAARKLGPRQHKSSPATTTTSAAARPRETVAEVTPMPAPVPPPLPVAIAPAEPRQAPAIPLQSGAKAAAKPPAKLAPKIVRFPTNDEIAAHIAAHGVTRLPTAAAEVTTATIPEADRAALAARPEPDPVYRAHYDRLRSNSQKKGSRPHG